MLKERLFYIAFATTLVLLVISSGCTQNQITSFSFFKMDPEVRQVNFTFSGATEPIGVVEYEIFNSDKTILLFNNSIQGGLMVFLEAGSGTTITHYAFFYAKSTCYYPFHNSVSIPPSTMVPGAVYFPPTVNFIKKSSCISQVKSISPSGNKINNPVKITTNIESAFKKSTTSSSPYSFIPPNKLNSGYYDSEIKVDLYVNGTLKDTKKINITIDQTKELEFYFTPTVEGKHNITIVTTPVDCQCATSLTNFSYLELNIGGFDMDGDGYNDTLAPGGTDCDDSDPDIHPNATEICNDKDDDCDDDTDEDLTKKCEDYTKGVCSTSTQECDNGEWLECEARKDEECNNLDDDCDGFVDESITRTCYSGKADTKGVGICRSGNQICTNGTWGGCTGEVLPNSKDICNNTKDDDCNGQIDELGCIWPELNLAPTPPPTPTPTPTPAFCGDHKLDPDESCLDCEDAACLTNEVCSLGDCIKKKDYSWAIIILLIILISVIALLIFYQFKGEGEYKLTIYILSSILVIIGIIFIISSIASLPTFIPTDSNATIILEKPVLTTLSATYAIEDNFTACLKGTYADSRYQISDIALSKLCTKSTLGQIKASPSCQLSSLDALEELELKDYRIYGLICNQSQLAFYNPQSKTELYYTIRDIKAEEEETTFSQAINVVQNLFSIILAIAAILGMYIAHKHSKKAPPVRVTDEEEDIVNLLKEKGGMTPTDIAETLDIPVDELTVGLRHLLRKNLIEIAGTTIKLKREIE